MYTPDRKPIHVLTAVLAALLLAACTSTRLTESWINKDIKDYPYRDFLIIGIADDDLNRRLFEDNFVDALKKRGIEAEPSYRLLPDSAVINRDSVAEAIKGKNIDAVLVTHMVSIDQETVYRQSMDYMPTQGYYNGLYNYYPHVYTYVNAPGYYTTHEIVKLETNVYDVASEKIAWSAQSRSFAPDSAKEVIDELTKLVISDLEDKGIIE
jgi:hypothetical protein